MVIYFHIRKKNYICGVISNKNTNLKTYIYESGNY